MNSVSDALKNMPWSDSTFERLEADYDEVRILLTNALGSRVLLRARAHISLAWIGHWDESILAKVELVDACASIDAAKERVRNTYGSHPTAGGGVRDLSSTWYALRLTFLDDVVIEVIAQSFSVEMIP